MPNIFQLDTSRWKLVIWTRDNATPKKTLSTALRARNRAVEAETIKLSFPLQGQESCHFDEMEIPVAEGFSEIEIPSPLCYENKDYEFEFIFKADSIPNKERPIIHRLSEIEKSFRTIGTSARGLLNFGNDIGWFRIGVHYHCEETTSTDTISFRVFPTKLDMEHDLKLIGDTIDSTYPLWRFSIAKRTEAVLARSRKKHESFELLWMAQFRSLANELAVAVRLICRSPHSRLLPEIKKLKADRLTGKTTGKLEERIKENLSEKLLEKRYHIEKRKLSFDTPENRFVKMVLSHSRKKIKLFTARTSALKSVPENATLSDSFFEELNQLAAPFEKLSAEPLFQEIGHFDGQMRESLVLHQRTGYAKVYRIWQQLKLYLDFFGSDASVSVRSVSKLYEIWCLLEIRRILLDLGFHEKSSPIRSLQTRGYEKHMDDLETFHFDRSDGMTAVLTHEPSYDGTKPREFGKIYSWTTTQRPDIFLEITLPSREKVRWIFDAKYRIDFNEDKAWPQKGVDTAPDDAINQMHRYRDALIHISQASEDGLSDKHRPIIGAFVLYPGWFEQDTTENPYGESIEEVGIGAFPLLPGQKNLWMRNFLHSQLGEAPKQEGLIQDRTDNLFLQEAVRIAPSGMKVYRHSDLILTANIYETNKGTAYVEQFEAGKAPWYHIPESTVQNHKISRYVMREMEYCAFFTKSAGGRECKYIYPIESVTLRPRREIDEYAGGPSRNGDTRLYWLIKLGTSIPAPIRLTTTEKFRSFRLRLFSLNDLLKAKSLEEIQEKYCFGSE